jgi:PAS domain S-box-containing protein
MLYCEDTTASSQSEELEQYLPGKTVKESIHPMSKMNEVKVLYPSLILVFFSMLVIMFVYEFAKQVINPSITLWESHVITIIFTSIISIIIIYFPLRSSYLEHQKTLDALRHQKEAEEKLRKSEIQYRSFVESVEDSIYTVDRDCRYLLINARHLFRRGLSPWMYEGKRFSDFHSQEETAIFAGQVARVLASKCLVQDEYEQKGRYYLRKLSPVIDPVVNEVIAVTVISSDITERKRAEETLKQTEERYRNVVEDQTEFICRFLPDGTHIFVNDAYCRYFDKKREDLIGHHFKPVLHPEDRGMVALHFTSLTSTHPVVNIDQRIFMPDGSIRWQQWSVRAIFDPNGRIIEYQSVGRDITEQKELEKEMEYHQQELRTFSTSLTVANKKLSLLSSITRHDINNQLTVILGYMDMLEYKEHDPTLDANFRMISTAAQRISAMIQFTGEYEKIGVNAPVWHNCRTLVENAVKQATLGQVIVINELPVSTEVYADPLVVKVFYNLIDNAVRYGGKITTIRFSFTERDDDQILVCEDDGEGVAAEDKERIFERGFGRNTGLGLALSREILSITGINIHETGEPGKGARFEMVIPKGTYRYSDVQPEKKL